VRAIRSGSHFGDFTGSVLILGAMFFAGPATFFFLTQFFQIVQGKSPLEAGLLILPNAGAIVLASVLAPPLGTAIGPRRTVMIAMSIMTENDGAGSSGRGYTVVSLRLAKTVAGVRHPSVLRGLSLSSSATCWRSSIE